MKKSTERAVWVGGAALGAAALVGAVVVLTKKSSSTPGASGGAAAGAKGPNGQPVGIMPIGSMCPPGQVFVSGKGCTPYVAPAPPPPLSQSGTSFILDPNNRTPVAYNYRGIFNVTPPHSVLPGGPVSSITAASFTGGVSNPLAAFTQFPNSGIGLEVSAPGTATITWQTQALGQSATQYTTVLTFV
jgi:hypothetical protein